MFINQTIQRPCGVNVFGSCLARVAPDTALVSFSVEQVDEKPAGAFEKTRQGMSEVRRSLAASGIDEREIRTSRITMEQAFRGYGKDAVFLGYKAEATFQVKVNALDKVEDVLVAAVDAGANRIHGVKFHTSRLKDVRAEARRRALEAARIKAESYCTAAGARLGRVIHSEDIDPGELSSRRGHGEDFDLTAHDESSEQGAADPGSITVAAAVMVGFALINQ